MFQNQYYNRQLTHDHIEKILANYNIKYNTMKNEIDAKFNSMIKLFINDIKAFLENIEEISNERKKIKEAENQEIEMAILKNKIEEKNKNENKLKYELELLKKENENLKKRINIKEQVIKNKNMNVDHSSNNIRIKTESNANKNKYKKFTTGKNNINYKTARKEKNNNLSIDAKTEEKKSKKIIKTHRNYQLSLNIEKNNNTDNLKYANAFKAKKKGNNSMDRRIIPSKKSKTNTNTLSTEKSPGIKTNQETVCTSNIQNSKNENIINAEKLDKIESPFDEHSFLEYDSLTTDEILNDEIKELEMEEENIILLMDKIKKLNQNI